MKLPEVFNAIIICAEGSFRVAPYHDFSLHEKGSGQGEVEGCDGCKVIRLIKELLEYHRPQLLVEKVETKGGQHEEG